MSAVREEAPRPFTRVRAAGPNVRGLAFAGLHLFALSAFALAQPLFDVLDGAPEFFVVRGSTRWDVVAFAVGLTIVPPALLLAAEAIARLAGVRAWTATHLVFVAALVGVIALQALKRVAEGPATALIAGAALVGALAALAYARVSALRSVLTVLAAAPVVFAGLFLFHSPVSKITLGTTEPATAAVADAPARTPIVFVIFDELPIVSLMDERRRIDRGRYPSFAALAGDSVWFRNATTVHEHSTEAIPSILTGRYPEDGLLPFVADHPANLFTVLPDGYRFDVFESVTRLCPSERCPRDEGSFVSRMEWLHSDLSIVYLQIMLPRELAKRLPPVTQTWMNYRGGDEAAAREDPTRFEKDIDVMVGHELRKDQVAIFDGFLSSIDASTKPALYFLHVMLPHSPWQYLPSGARYPNGTQIDGLETDTWRRDAWLVAQGWQRHLLQTRFTDRLLGRLLERLRVTGLYEPSLIVVLADHGVSFRPGDRRRGAVEGNLHDIALVPLFFKQPYQRRGRIVDTHVETIDILPSIADLLDLPPPAGADGESFFSPGYRPNAEVRLSRRAGEGPVSEPFSGLPARRDGTLAKQVRLFGSGANRRLFAVGSPARELVGRRVETAAGGPPAGLRVELDGQGLLGAVDLGTGVVPARITGRIEGGDARRGVALAIAVNGRIEAVTRTFADGEAVRFSALVPESAFRDGANAVDVFVVAGGRPGIRLAPIPAG